MSIPDEVNSQPDSAAEDMETVARHTLIKGEIVYAGRRDFPYALALKWLKEKIERLGGGDA